MKETTKNQGVKSSFSRNTIQANRPYALQSDPNPAFVWYDVRNKQKKS